MSETDDTQQPRPLLPMKDDVLQAMQALTRLENENKARVGEQVFREQLLPTLLTPGSDLDVWYRLAGSLQRPIIVVDGAGEELFTCPAPLRQLPTVTETARERSFPEISARVESLHLQHPIMALRYMDKMLEDRSLDYETDSVPEREQWIAILARYGYVVPGMEVESSSSGAASTPTLFSGQDEPL